MINIAKYIARKGLEEDLELLEKKILKSKKVNYYDLKELEAIANKIYHEKLVADEIIKED